MYTVSIVNSHPGVSARRRNDLVMKNVYGELYSSQVVSRRISTPHDIVKNNTPLHYWISLAFMWKVKLKLAYQIAWNQMDYL